MTKRPREWPRHAASSGQQWYDGNYTTHEMSWSHRQDYYHRGQHDVPQHNYNHDGDFFKNQDGVFRRVQNPSHVKGGSHGDHKYSRQDAKHKSRVGTSYEFEDDSVTPQRTLYCENCNMDGHLIGSCDKCYNCKSPGHRSTKCPYKNGLRICCQGYPDQFYSMHVPLTKCDNGAQKEVVKLMIIEEGDASVAIIRKELVQIFKGDKDWKIKQMANHKQFMISFPHADDKIEFLANLMGFKFETAKISARLRHTNMSYGAICCLEVVWVKVYVPTFAKLEDTIMALGYIVGHPIEVDHTSLETSCGPARVKISCVNTQIKLRKLIYLNGQGYMIKFEAEKSGGKNNSPPKEHLHNDKHKDEDNQDNQEDEEGHDKTNSSSKHTNKKQKAADGKKPQQTNTSVKHKVADGQPMGVQMEVLEDRLLEVVEGSTNLHDTQGMDVTEPNKEEDTDTNKTKISSGSSQIEFVNPCATMKSTKPIKQYYRKKAKKPINGGIGDNEVCDIPSDETTTAGNEAAKDSSKEINNQCLSTPNPSPDGFIKKAHTQDVLVRREVQRKLQYGEEDGDLKETIDIFRNKLSHFKKNMNSIIGEVGGNDSSHWKGSVVMSVVGAILTQNAQDRVSSDVFMELAAKFCSPTSVHQSSPNDEHSLEFEKLITSFREDKLSSWKEEDIKKIVRNKFTIINPVPKNSKLKKVKRFGTRTANLILKDILDIRSKDTSSFKDLVREAEANGYNKINDPMDDTICWEALLNAPYDEVRKCLEKRGQQSKLTFWILAFLFRINRDHGCLSLEWLKHIEPQKARRYLFSIHGLGEKCVELICLLDLKFPAFPVDVNVSRIALRLQWVPPPKGVTQGSQLAKYIHAHLWRLVSNMYDMDDEDTVKELTKLHYQLITSGKVIYRSEEQRLNHIIENVEEFGHNDNATEDVEELGNKDNATRTVFIIPDDDIILDKFDTRLPKDPNPYLLLPHLDTKENTKGTILIPCFTANKGTFPLRGSFFQKNEVFASNTPIEITSTQRYKTTTVYFGSSIASITSDQTLQKKEMIFKKGYICVRGFDCTTRLPHILPEWITRRPDPLQVPGKARGKKQPSKQKEAIRRHGSKPSAPKQRNRAHYDLR